METLLITAAAIIVSIALVSLAVIAETLRSQSTSLDFMADYLESISKSLAIIASKALSAEEVERIKKVNTTPIPPQFEDIDEAREKITSYENWLKSVS